MARGIGGGKFFQGMLRVDLDIPTNIRLDIDGSKLERNVGNKLASKIRKNLKRGLRGDGTPMPAPKGGGPPLRDSGELIKSIKYRQNFGAVAPSSAPRTDVSKRAGSSYGLLAILISGIGRGARQLPQYADVLGGGSEVLQQFVNELVNKEIARQLQKPSGGLKAELKRISKRV